VILSGSMMFEWMNWTEARDLVLKGIQAAIKAGTVTYDFARQVPGSTQVGTSAFADAIIAKM
jgi:isocitrate dehydrogenase